MDNIHTTAEARENGIAIVAQTFEQDIAKILTGCKSGRGEFLKALALYVAEWVHDYDDWVSGENQAAARLPH